MKRTILAVAVWMALMIPAAQSFAGGPRGAQQKKAGTAPGQRSAVLHAMRSRGVVKPGAKVQFVTGVDGSSRTYFFARGVSKRVSKSKAVIAGEMERVDVVGEVKPSRATKSGWSVTMKSTPARAPLQTLQR